MARSSLTPFGFSAADPISSLHREMNRLFDDVWRGGGLPAQASQGSGAAAFFNANMNVAETDGAIRVEVELPGVSENDVDISLEDDVLTIRGEKKFESERGGGKENFHCVERSYGSFQRSLRLPFQVNPEEVQADFNNGVLTVTVPKSAREQQRSRKIPIGARAGQGAAGEPLQPAQAAGQIPPIDDRDEGVIAQGGTRGVDQGEGGQAKH